MKVWKKIAASAVGILAGVWFQCPTAVKASPLPIEVDVNDNRVHFHDQEPVEIYDRVLVPLRGVLEAMGARVLWDPDRQEVLIRRGDHRIRLRMGSRNLKVDGDDVPIDVPPRMIGGRVMIPIRFISEAAGARVHWDESAEVVTIRT